MLRWDRSDHSQKRGNGNQNLSGGRRRTHRVTSRIRVSNNNGKDDGKRFHIKEQKEVPASGRPNQHVSPREVQLKDQQQIKSRVQIRCRDQPLSQHQDRLQAHHHKQTDNGCAGTATKEDTHSATVLIRGTNSARCVADEVTQPGRVRSAERNGRQWDHTSRSTGPTFPETTNIPTDADNDGFEIRLHYKNDFHSFFTRIIHLISLIFHLNNSLIIHSISLNFTYFH